MPIYSPTSWLDGISPNYEGPLMSASTPQIPPPGSERRPYGHRMMNDAELISLANRILRAPSQYLGILTRMYYIFPLMHTFEAGDLLHDRFGHGVPLYPNLPGSPRLIGDRVYYAAVAYDGRLSVDWMHIEHASLAVRDDDEAEKQRAIHRIRRLLLEKYARTAPHVELGRPAYTHRARTALARIGKEIGEAMHQLRECAMHDGEVNDFIEALNLSGIPWPRFNQILERTVLSDGRSLLDHGYELATACGHVHVRTYELHNGRAICEDCFDGGEYIYAEDDSELYHRDDLYRHSDGEYYTYEEEEEEEKDGEDPYQVMDYSTDVMNFLTVDGSFVSSSTGDFHMGVEFESVWVGYKADLHRQIAKHYDNGYAVAKYDGSISNGYVSGTSVEWVTRPTSLAKHIKTFSGWDMSPMRAWDCRSCGMHVHIDSKAFTKAGLAKIIVLYNSKENAAFLRSIAGRHPEIDAQARDYANFDSELDDDAPPLDPSAFAKIWKGKVGGGQGRYTMVNLCNLSLAESRRLGLRYAGGGDSNTVEFRLFRASTRKARLLAQLEFVHATVVWTRQAGIRQCLNMEPHFRAWLAARGDYPNLRAWLRTHREHGLRRSASAPVSLSVSDDSDTAQLATA